MKMKKQNKRKKFPALPSATLDKGAMAHNKVWQNYTQFGHFAECRPRGTQ